MRVLMLAHNVSERGSAIRALSIARWLAAAGRDVTVLSGRRHAGLGFTDGAMDGVRLLEPPDLLPYRFRNGGLSPIDLAGRLAHVLRERYDVVHTFEPRPCATLPGLLARRRKSVWVADWADLWGPDGMAATWGSAARGGVVADTAAPHARRVRRRPAVVHPSPRRRRHRDQQRPRAPRGTARDPSGAHPPHRGRRQRRSLPATAARRGTCPLRPSRRRSRPRAQRLRTVRRLASRAHLCRARRRRATRVPPDVRAPLSVGRGTRRSSRRRAPRRARRRRPLQRARVGDGLR